MAKIDWIIHCCANGVVCDAGLSFAAAGYQGLVQ